MNAYTIQPFYFPTTVAFVDDSSSFLENLALQLDSSLAYQLFRSPFSALVALDSGRAPHPMVQRFFSLYRHRDDAGDDLHVVAVKLGLIREEIHNEHRFEHVSVVVVDYDMPGIDGLEFCRRLRDPAIKKILLTGKADEEIAVRAFNNKTIDAFIRKQDGNAMILLNRSIRRLQQEYFRQIEGALSDVLSVGSYPFLHDADFAKRFDDIRKRLGIVEHYLCCTPDGILMLDAAGAGHLLLVQTEEAMRAQYEVARDQDAPDELLERIRSWRSVPYFWKTEGYYAPEYEDWRACLYPATRFNGNGSYLYAVVENPGAFNLEQVVPYRRYLDRLDSEARQPCQ